MGRLANTIYSFSRLLTVHTEAWPPKIQSISNTSWCRKSISTDIPGYYPMLSVLSFAGLATSRTVINIPVDCNRCMRRSIAEWCTSIFPATFLLLNSAFDISTYCNLSAKVNFRLTIFYRWKNSVRKLLQTLLANTFCVIMYDTICKPVLIENEFVDRWSDTL